MKKFYLMIMMIFMIGLSSCATASYARRTVNDIDEISYVLSNYYPELYYYYEEGVLRVNSVKEITLDNGELTYDIRYDFVRYYYKSYSERMSVLQEGFPELYQMYCNGLIEISSVYKYVDRDTGVIRHHVSYRRVNDYYYDYYYNSRYYDNYYRRRPIIIRPNPKPAPPRPEPRPDVRPNNPPRQEPNVRPNNPPRQEPNVRPNNNQSRPNNPPRTPSSSANRGNSPIRSNQGRGR